MTSKLSCYEEVDSWTSAACKNNDHKWCQKYTNKELGCKCKCHKTLRGTG